MTEVTLAPALAARFAGLTVVAEGDGYVLGGPHSPDYVAVPAIGGEVVRWLQAGLDLDECAARAAERVGEPVDVAGFVAGLAAAGLLAPEMSGVGVEISGIGVVGAAAIASTMTPGAGAAGSQVQHPAAPGPTGAGLAGPGGSPAGAGAGAAAGVSLAVPAGRARWGRALFGPVGLAVQGALALAGLAVLALVPALRPSYRDLVIGPVPLLSVLAITVISMTSAMLHELAHWLAAAARGVPSRITISRRLVSLVLQTDLTRLWGVPRRERIVPLVAGMLSDAASAGVLLLIGTVLRGDPWVAQFVRTVALLKLTGIAFQFQVFMRTDVYALYMLATRSRNLWDLKGALARRAVWRVTPADGAILAGSTRRERVWAGVYLVLYLPGVAWTIWYAAVYGVPALVRIVRLSVHGIEAAGPTSATGAAGIAALGITAASLVFVLRGLLRSIWRLGRSLARRSPRPAHP